MKSNKRRFLPLHDRIFWDRLFLNHTLSLKQLFLLLVLSSFLSCGLGLVWVQPILAETTKLKADQIAQASPDSNPRTDRLPAEISRIILQDAADRSGEPIARLKVTQSTYRTFHCIAEFESTCSQQFDPIDGWDVAVQVRSQTWRYHISSSGSDLFLDPQISATTRQPLPANIRDAVLRDAANKSGVPLPSLLVTKSTAKTFGNPCEFNFGEICTREYNPIEGWEVLVRVKSQIWKYHVNQSGSQIVLDPRNTAANAEKLPESIRRVLLRDAAAWTGLSEPAIKILDAQQRTWGNRCEFSFGSVCPANYAPISGWQVTVQARQLRWVYHISQDRKQVLMDRRIAMQPKVADAIVRDLVERSPRVATPDNLRFLEAKEKSQNVCTASGQCETRFYWLTIVSNGRQQWGYRADPEGRRVQQVPVAQVQSADR
jgi:uncharacterized protein YcnI